MNFCLTLRKMKWTINNTENHGYQALIQWVKAKLRIIIYLFMVKFAFFWCAAYWKLTHEKSIQTTTLVLYCNIASLQVLFRPLLNPSTQWQLFVRHLRTDFKLWLFNSLRTVTVIDIHAWPREKWDWSSNMWIFALRGLSAMPPPPQLVKFLLRHLPLILMSCPDTAFSLRLRKPVCVNPAQALKKLTVNVPNVQL